MRLMVLFLMPLKLIGCNVLLMIPELSVPNHVKFYFICNCRELMLFFVKLPITQLVCCNCFAFYVGVSSALHLMQTWESLNSGGTYF